MAPRMVVQICGVCGKRSVVNEDVANEEWINYEVLDGYNTPIVPICPDCQVKYSIEDEDGFFYLVENS